MAEESASRTVYLKSFDVHAEVLAYDVEKGTWRLLERAECEAKGTIFGFGAFTREGEHVMGVYASPAGPIIFVDSDRVRARLGELVATVADLDGHMCRFTLLERKGTVLRFTYKERTGLGANPYDQEPEDIDLARMIVKSLRGERFFTTYKREWD